MLRIERCMSRKEAENTILAKGLVEKQAPHNQNPKWVAKLGTRNNCNRLGKKKNYSHKIVFLFDDEFKEWLKKFETKVNEPDSYEIPANLLSEFNSKIKSLCQIVTWKRESKITGLKLC